MRWWWLRGLVLLIGWQMALLAALGDPRPATAVFERFTREQGLSSDAIHCLRQDQRGFLWIGTEDGLNRYDGLTFRVYRHQPDQPGSLPGNFVHQLYETRDGTLWVALDKFGFCRYDRHTDTFVGYASQSRYGRIHSFYEDRQGVLWVCTDGGLWRLDRRQEAFQPCDLKIPGSNDVYQVCEDREGRFWASCAGGLLRFDPASGEAGVVFPALVSKDGEKAGGWRIYGMTPEGWLRLAVGGGALALFDPAQERCMVQLDTYGNPLDTLPTEVTAKQSRAEVLLWEDQTVWLGRAGGLLQQLDLHRRTCQMFAPNPKRPGALVTSNLYCMLRDRAGVLWFGDAVAGLFRFSPTRSRFELYRHHPFDENSLSDSYIRGIVEDRQGNVWVATQHGGLNCLDRQTGRVTRYRARPDDPKALRSDEVWAVYEDRQGDLWVGTTYGVQRLDRVRGIFQSLPVLPDKVRVQVIQEDTRGALWVGSEEGLYEISPDRRQCRDHTPDVQRASSVRRIDVQTIHVSPRDGQMWIGLAYRALRYDPVQQSYREYRVDTRPEYGTPYVTHFVEDREGTLWMVTKGAGLCRFDAARETFTHITERDGLPHNNCYAMFPDAEGTFWLSSDAGIVHFDPTRMRFRSYTVADGLQGPEFNRVSAFRNARGELFFGGTNGLNVFHPSNLVNNPVPPPVVLTGLRINGVAQPAWEGMALRLPHDRNALDLGYAGLDFHVPEDNRYRCWLEGFDREWRDMGGRREVGYTNLPPGQYRFWVMAANHDGVWGPGTLLLAAEIQPPWWQTWPAYVGFVTLGGLILYGGVRWRLRQLVARTRWLEGKVAERTQEVTRKNEELAARNLEIEAQRREMLESLGYARTIQQAMLPSAETLTAALGEHFVLWKPKDIVSGDFYWLHEQDGEVVLVVADCTGHGVPGAFMSTIGSDLLGKIVADRGVRQPAEILHQLHHGIERMLRQGERQTLLDGMDAAVCTLQRETGRLTFAGARRPLYLMADGVLTELKGDRATVGGSSRERRPRHFTPQQVMLTPGMMLYLTTDGFADQPNDRGKKYGTRRLLEVLASVSGLPPAEQQVRLEAELAAHMGAEAQRDDITVFGFRVALPSPSRNGEAN